MFDRDTQAVSTEPEPMRRMLEEFGDHRPDCRAAQETYGANACRCPFPPLGELELRAMWGDR